MDNQPNIIKIAIGQIPPNNCNPSVVPAGVMAKVGAEIGQKGLTVPITVRRRGDVPMKSWMASPGGEFAEIWECRKFPASRKTATVPIQGG